MLQKILAKEKNFTSDHNKFTSNTLYPKIKQKILANEYDLNEKDKSISNK